MRVVLEYHDIGHDADIPIFIASKTRVIRQYTSCSSLNPRIVFEVKDYNHLQEILALIYQRNNYGIKLIRVGTWKDKIKELFKKMQKYTFFFYCLKVVAPWVADDRNAEFKGCFGNFLGSL